MERTSNTSEHEEVPKVNSDTPNGTSWSSDRVEVGIASKQPCTNVKCTSSKKPYRIHASVFAVLSILLAVLLVLFIVLYEEVKSDSKKDAGYCSSKDCVTTASRMLEAMNSSVDPCSDFYQYACGGWIKKASIPDHGIQYGRLHDLSQQNKVLVKDMLNELIQSGDHSNSGVNGSAISKTVEYYQSCVSVQTQRHLGAATMQQVIKKLGSSPITDTDFNSTTWDSLDVFVKLHSELGVSPLFSIDILPDLRNSTNHISVLTQSGLGLKMHREAYLSNISGPALAVRNAYAMFAKEMWTMLGDGKGLKYLDEVIEFEKHLAELSRPLIEQRNYLRYYERMSILTFVNRTKIPQKWIAELLERTVLGEKRSISMQEQIASLNTEYIRDAYSAFANLSMEVQASYLVWQGVQHMVPVIIGPYEEILLDYFKIVGGFKDKPPAWELCVDRTLETFGFVLADVYVKRVYDNEAQHKSLKMIDRIKKQFQKDLHSITWLDDAAKEYAIQKALGMIENIGYPDNIFNSSQFDEQYSTVDVQRGQIVHNILEARRYNVVKKYSKYGKPVVRSDWELHPLTVNAFYSPTENKITFPTAIFQWPLYDKRAPFAHAYGSIGMVFGHEISHAFDNIGKNFDINGDFNVWWTQKSHKEFINKSQCFVEQYNTFKVLEGTKYEQRINGRQTLGENIADNGGVRQARMGYQSWVYENGKEQTLPGLDLTSDQLFFLSFAQCWCTKFRPAALPLIMRAPHSIPEFRVMGVLQNLKEFSDAFKCHRGSRMNPDKKCVLW